MLVINVVYDLKCLNPLKKVNLLYINYCTDYIHSLLQHIHS